MDEYVFKNLRIPDKYDIIFSPEANKIVRNDENIRTVTKIIVDTDDPVEIRRLELKNNGVSEEVLEITALLEPVLSNAMQDFAHKAFNNLFVSFEYIDSINTIVVKRKHTLTVKRCIYGSKSI